MKTFTYVIAPEGCKPYLTPGKKYKIITASESKHAFWVKDDTDYILYCLIAGCANLNGKDWIIPEIGQWPEGWSDISRIECLRKAGALISIESYLQEPNKGDWNFMAPADSDYQGRTQQQVEGSYKIMAICFIAFAVVLVIAAILKVCS